MIAALQCLNAIVNFQQVFIDTQWLPSDRAELMPLFCSFTKLIKRLNSKTSHAVISVDALKIESAKLDEEFGDNDQKDWVDFIISLLNKLHDAENSIAEEDIKEEPKYDAKKCVMENANIHWSWYLDQNVSAVQNCFDGQQQSTRICDTCNNKSIKFDAMKIISLQMINKSLIDCLKAYFGVEVMNGSNSIDCQTCGKTNGTK